MNDPDRERFRDRPVTTLTRFGANAIFAAMRARHPIVLLLRAVVLAAASLSMTTGYAFAHGAGAGHRSLAAASVPTAHEGHHHAGPAASRSAELASAELASAEHAPAEPASTELTSTELASAEHAPAESASTEPASTEPASTELATTELATTQLASTELASAEFATTELASTELASAGFAPPELASTEHASAKPACHDRVETGDRAPAATPCPDDRSPQHASGGGCCTMACHAALTVPAIDTPGVASVPAGRLIDLSETLEGRSSDRTERPPKRG